MTTIERPHFAFPFELKRVYRDWVPTDIDGCELWLAADKVTGYNSLASEIAADTPALWWRAGDASSPLADSSGNSRTGTVVGGTFNQDGLVSGDTDGALFITGATNSSGIHSSYAPWTGTKTFETRLRAGGYSATAVFGTPTGTTHALRIDPTGVLLFINGSPIAAGAWSGTYSANITYHVVLTADFTTGAYELFINGVSQGAKTGQATPSSNPNFSFGYANGSLTNGFGGTVDELAIYNSILSPARILAHYDAGKPLATWADASGLAHDATTATASHRPLYKTGVVNGKPAIYFDVFDDGLSSVLGARSTRTIFVVAKTTGGGSRWDIMGLANNARVQNSLSDWAYVQDQSANPVWLGGNSTVFGVIGLRYNSTSSADIFLNGGAAHNFNPDDSFSTSTTLGLGGDSGAGYSPFGYIAEVLSFAGALSSTDFDTVRNYLGMKYGLGFGSMPSQVVDSIGAAGVVEQDTPDHIVACENMIVRCPLGYRLERPEFGWRFPEFATAPVDPDELTNALRRFEPRGHATAEEYADVADAAVRHIQVEIGV